MALIAAIIAAHLAAILVLLAPAPPVDMSVAQRRLSLFDVIPPPPLPPSPPALPENAGRTVSAGGSPGTRRERPAPPVERNRAPSPQRPDTTITAAALSLPPSGPALDALGIDLGLGPGTGDTDGNGGDGRGTGTGGGDGAGDGIARYAQAKWIVRPTDTDFYRFWPTREVDGRIVRQRGWAYLACQVTSRGQPHECRALHEVPVGVGMGAAAIEVATRSRVRPVFRNDAALAGLPVLIPIVFGTDPVRIPRVSAAFSAPRAR